jgi:hypothetical protein
MTNQLMGCTRHCETRMQQRSIDSVMIDLLMQYGNTRRRNKADVTTFNKKSRHLMAQNKKYSQEFINKIAKLYIVEIGGKIITTSRRLKRFKNN